MTYESTQIMSRIEWCRLQQQVHSVTRDERAGWRAEEVGLSDALLGRDRTARMREGHRSQFTRYEWGLEDGQALLCLQHFNSLWDDTYGGIGPSPLATPARVDSRSSQVPRPVHVESRR